MKEKSICMNLNERTEKKLIIIFIVLNILDVVLTAIGFSYGLFEGNPLYTIYNPQSVALIVAVKIIGVGIILCIYQYMHNSRPGIANITLMMCASLYILVCFSNIHQIYLAKGGV
jgi:hypothetical protein